MTTCDTTTLVTWSDRYSVGISQIDSQHRKLIDAVNELYAAMLKREDSAILGRVLDSVAAYTVSHFTAEEGLMKRHRYPAYAQHKAEHDKLVDQVQRLQRECHAGKPVISQEVMTFLQHWLMGHILGMDKKYTAHLQAAGVK